MDMFLAEQEQHKQYIHKWVWLCSNKTLFAKNKKRGWHVT